MRIFTNMKHMKLSKNLSDFMNMEKYRTAVANKQYEEAIILLKRIDEDHYKLEIKALEKKL